jgi:hypothetical protein
MRWGLFVLAVAACHPKIKAFEVEPTAYCSTRKKVRVAWLTENGTTTVKVGDEAPRGVDSAGALEIDARDTTVTLLVQKGPRGQQLSKEVRGVESLPVVQNASGCNGTAVFTEMSAVDYGGGPVAWDPNARLSVISNKCPPGADATATCRRKLEIEHQTHRWTLQPDSALDVSSSKATLDGPYKITATLLDGETCEASPGAQVLRVSVEPNCD